MHVLLHWVHKLNPAHWIVKRTEPWAYLYSLLLVSTCFRRKDLPLKNSTTDIILITGVLSAYASMVEKLHKDMPDKNKATILKVERAGDVLLDAVSNHLKQNSIPYYIIFCYCY